MPVISALPRKKAIQKRTRVWAQIELHRELEVSLRPSTEKGKENKEKEKEKKEEMIKILMIFSH